MLREFINRYLKTVLAGIFAIGFLAYAVLDFMSVHEFISKGERHTLDHAIQDCIFLNSQIETQRDCEAIYK